MDVNVDRFANAVETTAQVVAVGGAGAVAGGVIAMFPLAVVANAATTAATVAACTAAGPVAFAGGALIGATYGVCKLVQYWRQRARVRVPKCPR